MREFPLLRLRTGWWRKQGDNSTVLHNLKTALTPLFIRVQELLLKLIISARLLTMLKSGWANVSAFGQEKMQRKRRWPNKKATAVVSRN